MAAISQQIPNLLGGVSQQPDPLKLPGQVREAENVLLDPTFGCRKRPPTKFLARLATDIPKTAKWFPIFRDKNERYVACVYKNASNNTILRVWEADTGAERTVTMLGDSAQYLTVSDVANLKELSINDYTLLCNSEKRVSMSADKSATQTQEALVVVNQVAYNTTYAVDFLRDGQAQSQQKVYRASKLTISPGGFEDEANGNCSAAGTQSYSETSGAKTGLGFTVTTSCNPTLVTTQVPGSTYPTGLTWASDSIGIYFTYQMQAYFTYKVGSANNFPVGSYKYATFTQSKPQGNITVRIEVIVDNDPETGNKRFVFSSASITNYTITGNPKWSVNDDALEVITLPSNLERYPGGQIFPAGSTVGMRFLISSVQTAPSTPNYTYKSVYTTRVTLNNGGQNWRRGDSVTVTMLGRQYTVTVEEETFSFSYASESQVSFTTPLDQTTGTLNIGAITSNLTASINALGSYQATPVGNVIYIKRTDSREFNIQTRGGTANNALYGIKGSVNDVSLLPSQCIPGMVLMVRNTANSDADDYYVKFVSGSGDIPGNGSWEETVKPGILTDLNTSTMPHALIRESNGAFTVRPLSRTYNDKLYWAPREIGDDTTNPTPSFVGGTITDMFFFMNRLGLLSADSVVLSQPGDYFNFFVGSAIAVSDADPIDMTASSTKPAQLKAAIGTPKGLLLFAENSQFLLATSEAAFGPATVKMTELSNYAYTSNVHPLETGVSILFSTEADTYSKVFEMAVDSIDNRPLVAENTRIVPEYIPPDLTFATSSPNNSFVAYGNDTENLWIFKFFNTGNERSLAGWSKWVLPCPVRLFSFAHDSGYFVLDNGTAYVLAKLEMIDDPETSPISAYGSKFVPRLDFYLYKSETTRTNQQNGTTIIRFPAGSYVAEAQPCLILTKEGTSTAFFNLPIQQDNTGYYITADTEIANEDYILGLVYDMKIQLPSFWLTVDKKADRKNIPMVETVYLDLYYSGRYNVTVEKLGYSPISVDLDVTPADIYKANSAAVQDVTTKEVPIFSRGDFATVTINAPDPLPASITSYSWEGHYSTRGINLIR
jgi:hypothetical protein